MKNMHCLRTYCLLFLERIFIKRLAKRILCDFALLLFITLRRRFGRCIVVDDEND